MVRGILNHETLPETEVKVEGTEAVEAVSGAVGSAVPYPGAVEEQGTGYLVPEAETKEKAGEA